MALGNLKRFSNGGYKPSLAAETAMEGAIRPKLQIPMKPAGYSDLKAATVPN